MTTDNTRASRAEKQRQDVIIKFSWLVAVLGLAVLVTALATVWTTGWGPGLFAPGATLLVAALTGMVTTKGIVTWNEQRARDRETSGYTHREKEYERIAASMVARFADENYDKIRDSEIRARAAVWAAPEVIRAFGEWQQQIGHLIARGTELPRGQVSLNVDQVKEVKAIMGRVIAAMRRDLEIADDNSDVTPSEIVKVIFN